MLHDEFPIISTRECVAPVVLRHPDHCGGLGRALAELATRRPCAAYDLIRRETAAALARALDDNHTLREIVHEAEKTKRQLSEDLVAIERERARTERFQAAAMIGRDQVSAIPAALAQGFSGGRIATRVHDASVRTDFQFWR